MFENRLLLGDLVAQRREGRLGRLFHVPRGGGGGGGLLAGELLGDAQGFPLTARLLQGVGYQGQFRLRRRADFIELALFFGQAGRHVGLLLRVDLGKALFFRKPRLFGPARIVGQAGFLGEAIFFGEPLLLGQTAGLGGAFLGCGAGGRDGRYRRHGRYAGGHGNGSRHQQILDLGPVQDAADRRDGQDQKQAEEGFPRHASARPIAAALSQ